MPVPEGHNETAPSREQPTAASLPQKQTLVPAHNGRLVPAPQQRATAYSAATTVTPTALLHAFRRRMLVALTLGVLLAGVGATAVWFLLPPGKASVASLLHVAASAPKIASDVGDQADFRTYQSTQLALIKSRLVLNAALRSTKVASLEIVNLQPEPLEWLEKEVKVGFTQSPEILQISMTGDRTEELKTIVDAITDAYLEEIVYKQHNERQKRYQKLKEIARRYEDKVKGIRKSMRALQEQAMLPGDAKVTALRQQQAQSEYTLASADLAKVRSDLRSLKLQLVKAETAPVTAFVVNEATILKSLAEDALIKKYQERFSAAQELLDENEKRAKRGAKEPALIPLRNAVLGEKRKIEQRARQIRPLLVAQQKETYLAYAKNSLVGLRQRIEFQTELEKLLAKDVDRLAGDAKQLVGRALDLEEFNREITQAEGVAKRLNERAENINVEAEAEVRVRRLQEAVSRFPDEFERKVRTAGLTGVGLFGFVLLGVSFLEFRLRRLASANELTDGLGLNVVGTLPAVPMRPRQLAASDWQRRMVESVDAARTLLLGGEMGTDLRIVMIASAVSGEGKTSLAAHLATSLARAGRQTLLIDGDLRKPNLHGVFHLNAMPGLADLLRDPGRLNEMMVQETSIPGLSFLPAGARDERTFRSLALNGIAPILDFFREQYDIIVIDSSPVLPVADAMMVAPHVDGVLFSVLQDVSRLPRVATACQRLVTVGGNIIGAVISGSKEDNGYGYGYYYYNSRKEEADAQAAASEAAASESATPEGQA
jgi:capsular exopolysaccharide synthesis family protein